MNKILSTLALAGLAGASLAHAELEGLSIKGKVDYETQYIFRGKEHSDDNVQTKVVGEYQLPLGGANASIYAGAFLMSPLTQSSNEGDIFVGAKTEVEKFLLDAGYTYYGYPNRDLGNGGKGIGGTISPVNNRAIYSDSNEVSLGVAYSGFKDIATPSLYFHYNFDLQQLTTEAALRKSFKGDEFGIAGFELILAGFLGFVDANAYNGDQRAVGVEQWRNGYTYVGGSVDVAYNVTNAAKVGVGVRYSYNNDGNGTNGDDIRTTGNTESNFWYGIWAEFRY